MSLEAKVTSSTHNDAEKTHRCSTAVLRDATRPSRFTGPLDTGMPGPFENHRKLRTEMKYSCMPQPEDAHQLSLQNPVLNESMSLQQILLNHSDEAKLIMPMWLWGGESADMVTMTSVQLLAFPSSDSRARPFIPTSSDSILVLNYDTSPLWEWEVGLSGPHQSHKS